LEFEVESQFEGRPITQLASIIVSQVCRSQCCLCLRLMFVAYVVILKTNYEMMFVLCMSREHGE